MTIQNGIAQYRFSIVGMDTTDWDKKISQNLFHIGYIENNSSYKSYYPT